MVTLRNMMSHALYSEDLTMRHRRARRLLENRNTERPLSSAEMDELRSLLADLEQRNDRITQTDQRIQGALGRMQEDVLALRVVPVGMVFSRLSRIVHDLAQAQQKQVALEISGEDVRIDKSLVDSLFEPLMHMVRNGIDHGIEPPATRTANGKAAQATLRITARQQGASMLIEVADDGRGLDIERIRQRALQNNLADAADVAGMGDHELANLIFLPGFSTADTVTSVSGRGVGMDVVRLRISQLGGQVDVQSTPGTGTVFTLRLPLSVAIQSVVLVAAGSRQLAIPERNVTEVISLAASSLQTIQGQACCLLRGITLPLYRLTSLLGDDRNDRTAETGALLEIVVISDGRHRIGLLVDHVDGRPEVFVRDLHPDLARIPGIGGVSVLGDGSVVIIVDCDNLFEIALHNAQSLRSLLRAS